MNLTRIPETGANLGVGALDPPVKEMPYVTVSTANGCEYCVHFHTAPTKAKGITPQMHRELLAVIGMAAQTNAPVTGWQTPADDQFKA